MRLLFLLLTLPLFAQEVQIMTYNILNYPGSDTYYDKSSINFVYGNRYIDE